MSLLAFVLALTFGIARMSAAMVACLLFYDARGGHSP
jgi:hypothetical protein